MSDHVPVRKEGDRVRIMQVDNVHPYYHNKIGRVLGSLKGKLIPENTLYEVALDNGAVVPMWGCHLSKA